MLAVRALTTKQIRANIIYRMRALNKHIKNNLKSILNWPYKVFLILFLLSAITCVLALRSNNQTMVDLRSAVYAADKEGGDINGSVNKLRQYVYSHMNTDLSSGGNSIKPPLQLKHTYEHLQEAEKQRVDTINEKIYTDAQGYCERQNPTSFSGGARVPCIEAYVKSNGAKPNTIPAGLYQFDFISPAWSPDLAGWSLVLSILFFLSLATSFGVEKLVKTKIKP